MKKVIALFMIIGIVFSCITPVLATSGYQEWENYADSPADASGYPYKAIVYINYQYYLICNMEPMYLFPDGRIRLNGHRNYRLSGDTWSFFNEATYESPASFVNIIEANFPIYTDETKGTIYFDRTTFEPIATSYEAMSYLDYLLVIPDVERDFDSWNLKISVKESTPMGDYWRYLDQYILTQKYAWRFDKTSPSWQGRNQLYKFDITYFKDNEEVSTSIIEPQWNPIEEVRSLMPKFTIKNNDWKIQLASTYDADYSVVLNKILTPSTIVNTSVIPINLVDDVFHLSDTFITFYNMDESEVGFYYELYIMNQDKSKLYAKFNWTRSDLKDWKKYDFTIETPLKYDVASLVSNQYGSSDYVNITPDVVIDSNGDFVVSNDPLDSAIDGLSSIKSSILGANNLMLSVVDMLVGYPLISTGIMMMSGVMVILVAVVIVKIFK